MTEQIGTTKTFNMPVDEIIEFALQAIGGDHFSAKESKLARTALNLVFIDLQNRGMAPLSSMELVELTLVSGSSMNYPLGSDVFSVFDAVVEVSSSTGYTDLNLERKSLSDWLKIPTKETSKGRPTSYLVDKQPDNTFISFWPVPNTGTYSFKAWAMKKIGDVNKSYQLLDLPSSYLPAIIAGLRYHMAGIRNLDANTKMALKQEYVENLMLALEEDRERVSFRVYPESSVRI